MRYQSILLSSIFLVACGQADSPPAPELKLMTQLKATASGDGNPALSVKPSGAASFQEAKPGEQFLSGATVKTSPSGRASLDSPGVKRFELNSDTELSLHQDSFRLNQGEIFLDTPPSQGKPLRIELLKGSITTQGAAVNIKQKPEGASVNVLKGQVTLQSPTGEVTLRAAEGATVTQDGTTQKGPSADFTSLTEWTLALQRAVDDRPTEASSEPSLPPPGFGTLSAKTPGTKKERPFLLLSQEVKVTIHDQMAQTEIEEIFENPSNVVVEGSFRFTLPEGASVTRYAMYVKDTLMEGEIVDRDQGRKILKAVVDEYLEEQARLRDPALTEWVSGNTFSTRIFPIMPKEKKKIILAYTQQLETQDGQTRYVYPLAVAGAHDKIGAFRFAADISSSSQKASVSAPLYPVQIESKEGLTTALFEAKDFQAPADLVLQISNDSQKKLRLTTAASKKGEPDYFMLSLQPTFTGELEKNEDWIILVDTSQSRTATEMAIQSGLVRVFFGALDYTDRVKVFAYDYTTREITDGWTTVSDAIAPTIEGALQAITPGGATNLSSALAAAAKASEGRPVRVMLVGDLTPSTGEIRPEVLAQEAKKLFHEKTTLSTVGVGSVDDLVLEALPRAMGGASYRISDGEDLSLAAMRILSGQLRPLLSDVSVKIDGVEATGVYPEYISALPSGRELHLIGRYKTPGTATITVSGRVGQSPFEQKFQTGFAQDTQNKAPLQKLWAKERIDALSENADAKARAEISALSKSAGVMSRYTSYIVLESDAMYKEFGVAQQNKEGKKEASKDNPAEDAALNSGIQGLIKGGAGSSPFASVFGRDDAVGSDSENILGGLIGDRPGEAEGGYGLGLQGTGIGGGGTGEGTIGLGNDNTVGKGGSGSGIGYGRGTGKSSGSTYTAPDVVDGKAEIKGSLDKEIIRRVIRRATNGIKFCYEQALQTDPSLSGRVKIFFVIAATGAVASASPVGTGVSAEVDQCTARKISQLSFPAPQGGGIVEVTYPFTFQMTTKTNSSDSYSPSYRDPWSCDTNEASIRTSQAKATEAEEKKLAELRATLAADPLVRSSHQKVVAQLALMGRYPEALDQALIWRSLDSANVGLLKTISELYRMGGHPEESVRLYSGVLDLDPENAPVVESLAAYAAAKGHTEEAYSLRLGRALQKPNDPKTQLDLAEAALGYGLTAKASEILASWVQVDAKGKVSVTGKLSGAQKKRALALYTSTLTPNKETTKKPAASKRSDLFVTISWEGQADLDLWIVGPNGRPVFGNSFVESHNGTSPESLEISKASMGRYRVQVFDASTQRPTSDIKAKITLYGFKGQAGEQKKEIELSIKPGGGVEIGSLSLARHTCQNPYGYGFGGM